jgi:hypothetical protein
VFALSIFIPNSPWIFSSTRVTISQMSIYASLHFSIPLCHTLLRFSQGVCSEETCTKLVSAKVCSCHKAQQRLSNPPPWSRPGKIDGKGSVQDSNSLT